MVTPFIPIYARRANCFITVLCRIVYLYTFHFNLFNDHWEKKGVSSLPLTHQKLRMSYSLLEINVV